MLYISDCQHDSIHPVLSHILQRPVETLHAWLSPSRHFRISRYIQRSDPTCSEIGRVRKIPKRGKVLLICRLYLSKDLIFFQHIYLESWIQVGASWGHQWLQSRWAPGTCAYYMRTNAIKAEDKIIENFVKNEIGNKDKEIKGNKKGKKRVQLEESLGRVGTVIKVPCNKHSGMPFQHFWIMSTISVFHYLKRCSNIHHLRNSPL